MSHPSACTTCGSALPDGVSEKHCPACLLKAGMEAETVPSGLDDHPDSMDDRHAPST